VDDTSFTNAFGDIKGSSPQLNDDGTEDNTIKTYIVLEKIPDNSVRFSETKEV
jgi:hypothetical protein